MHNGNQYPSVPVGHAVHMKETHENMSMLLDCIPYSKYKWNICGDLKVISLLLGLQAGYTLYGCFQCEWDSQDRSSHYIRKVWPPRQSMTPGQKKVAQKPLIESKSIYLPPLHIKLGLMKNFVKAMHKDDAGFNYLRKKFAKISEAK